MNHDAPELKFDQARAGALFFGGAEPSVDFADKGRCSGSVGMRLSIRLTTPPTVFGP